MKIRKMPVMHHGGVNVTPLIDVVMCLIIFFMLVAKIGMKTGAEKMNLPTSTLGVRIPLGNTVTLNVRQGDQTEPVVTTLIDGGIAQVMVRDGDAGHQSHPLREMLQQARASNPNVKVIIRAPWDLPYEFMEPVFQACAEAGIGNLNYTTEAVR